MPQQLKIWVQFQMLNISWVSCMEIIYTNYTVAKLYQKIDKVRT
jgi:hypothetical protein